MRVVMLVHEFPKASETFLVNKFLGLLARGVDVHLVAEREIPEAWGLYPDLSRDAGARRRVHLWPSRSRPAAILSLVLREGLRALVRSPLTSWLILRRVLAHPVDEVPDRFAFAAFIERLRPDVLHFEFGTIAAHRPELMRSPRWRSVASFRGWDVNYFALDEPTLLERVFDDADALHFVSSDLRNRALRRGLSANVPFRLIPPAIDLTRFGPRSPDARTRRVSGNERLRLLSVGRLHWKKGYEFALHAVRLVRDKGVAVDYRIIGEGPFKQAVLSCIRDLDLEDDVCLLGVRSQEGVRDELTRVRTAEQE